MTISTLDQLVNALGNNNSRIIIDKASLANQTAGSYCSMWRATGQPAQGAIPTTAATCDHTTTGGVNFAQQTSPSASYIAYADVATSNAAMTVELHDRLAQHGGLVGNVATLQTITGFDLSTLGGTNNVDERKGDADYSDVSWWLEWYADTGSTAVTATVNVTYNDGTTGNLSAIALAATRRIGYMINLNVYVPTATPAKFIRGVNSVQLSVSSGTAGNFGVTASRQRAAVSCPIANFKQTGDWAQLGLPLISNSSCLWPIVLTSTTSSGTLRGQGKIIHG